MDLKESKSGKHYFQVDTWEPKPRAEETTAPPKAKAKAKAPEKEEDPSLPF